MHAHTTRVNYRMIRNLCAVSVSAKKKQSGHWTVYIHTPQQNRTNTPAAETAHCACTRAWFQLSDSLTRSISRIYLDLDLVSLFALVCMRACVRACAFVIDNQWGDQTFGMRWGLPPVRRSHAVNFALKWPTAGAALPPFEDSSGFSLHVLRLSCSVAILRYNRPHCLGNSQDIL